MSKTKTNTECCIKKPYKTVYKKTEENATVFCDNSQLHYGRQTAFDASVLEALSIHQVVPNLEHTPDDDEIMKGRLTQLSLLRFGKHLSNTKGP